MLSGARKHADQMHEQNLNTEKKGNRWLYSKYKKSNIIIIIFGKKQNKIKTLLIFKLKARFVQAVNILQIKHFPETDTSDSS